MPGSTRAGFLRKNRTRQTSIVAMPPTPAPKKGRLGGPMPLTSSESSSPAKLPETKLTTGKSPGVFRIQQ